MHRQKASFQNNQQKMTIHHVFPLLTDEFYKSTLWCELDKRTFESFFVCMFGFVLFRLSFLKTDFL